MKASELIAELQNAIKAKGDLEVLGFRSQVDTPITHAKVFDVLWSEHSTNIGLWME